MNSALHFKVEATVETTGREKEKHRKQEVVKKKEEAFKSLWVRMCVCSTCDRPPDLPGCLLSHLQRCLFAVPGSMRGADQVGSVLQRTLTETDTCADTVQSVTAATNGFIYRRLIYRFFFFFIT